MEELLSTSGDSSIQDSLLGMIMPVGNANANGAADHSSSNSSSDDPTQPPPPPPQSPLTNALLVSSPYKLVPPPKETDWDPWGAEARKAALTVDLWDALRDPDLQDVHLVASDGEHVAASRFVLAARSPVLKRMLYGSFREAKSSTICMMGYETVVLKAVVQYCTTNALPPWSTLTTNGEGAKTTSHDLESSLRQLVRLYQAADFLELAPLGDLVHLEIRRLTGLYPGLACVVFDEVDDTSSRIGDYARLMMEVRPYVSLGAGTMTTTTTLKDHPNNKRDDKDDDNEKDEEDPNKTPTKSSSSKPTTTTTTTSKGVVDLDDDCNHSMGGVECLRAERLQEVFKSPNLLCGELFLFQMLRQWYDFKVGTLGDTVDDSVEYETEATTLLDAAAECASCLDMENIEPHALIHVVQPCPFIHPSLLFDAFAKQALRASQNRIWTLHARPQKYQAVERVLVEDCGSRQARGMYVRMVSNLKKSSATLYTKREVVSGQAMVYTLSCSISQGQVECRIFCSPLLTPQAIPTLLESAGSASSSGGVDPLFQPILQIVAMKPITANGNNNKRSRTVVVSDGHYCMHATLADGMAIHNHSKELQLYSVVQVLAFRLYASSSANGSKSSSSRSSSSTTPKIHIQRVSIVNSNAGQVFGRPTFFKTNNAAVALASNANNNMSTTTDEATVDDGESAATNSVSQAHAADLLVVEDANTVEEGDDDLMDRGAAVGVKNLQHVTVLYSCSYPLKKQARDTRIPRSGWTTQDAGQSPPPTCAWFPPVSRSVSLHATTTTAAAVSNAVQGFRQSAPAIGSHKNNKSGDSSLGLSLSLGSSSTTAPKQLSSILKYDGDIEDAIDDRGNAHDDDEEEDDDDAGHADSSRGGESTSLGPLSLGPPIP